MKTYINSKTGAIIDSSSIISGGDWGLLELSQAKEEVEEKKSKKSNKK